MTAEEEIRRTLASYCQTCDDGRFDEFAELFAEDAQFQVGDAAPVVGREQIRAFMEKAQPPEARGKHLCGEPLIAVADDEATASTDFVFAASTGQSGWSVKAAGRYEDELVQTTDGQWRFRARKITML